MPERFDHIPVFDADNHIYEPIEALTKYLPERHKGKVQLVQVGNRTRIALRGQITDYIPNPTFEVVAAPGAHAKFYAGINPEGLTLREMSGKPIRLTEAMRFPEARLALMDEQRIEGTIMFPTLANLVEYHVADDPMLTHDLIHALNQWIDEVWTFDRGGRVYSAAAITLALVDRAVEELEWALDRGARVLLMRPAPVVGFQGSRAFSLPEFDPFWARVEEAGVAVCLHATETVLARYADLWEPVGNENAFQMSPFRHLLQAHRDIEDTLAGLICHGTLQRFPGLRFASVENGAEWVAPFLDNLARSARRNPKSYPVDPVEQFRQHVFVNPFWEEDIPELLDRVGDHRVLYGSDYPHPEGLADPREYFDFIEDLDEATIKRIVHDNALELLGV